MGVGRAAPIVGRQTLWTDSTVVMEPRFLLGPFSIPVLAGYLNARRAKPLRADRFRIPLSLVFE